MSTSAAESAVTGDDAAVPPGNSFHLEWNNHLPNMQAVLEALYSHQSFVDVTLACSDGILKAHKVILSACSPYFEALFRDVPCKHPVLVLRGVNVREMHALLRYMYRGQVDVPEQELSALFTMACEFKVKGFSVDAMKASGPHPESKLHSTSEDEDDEEDEDEDDNEQEVDPLMLPTVDSEPVNSTAAVGLRCSPTPMTQGEEASGADREEAPSAAPPQPTPEDSLPSTSSAEPPAQEEAAAEPVASPSDTSCDPAPAGTLEDPAAAMGDAAPAASTSCDLPPAADSPISLPNAAPTASPFCRETRYKGQKRVDTGLQPTVRTRSRDKRDDSASRFARAATTTPQARSVPAPGPPPAKKLRSSGVVLTPVPTPSGHGRTGAPGPAPGPTVGPAPAQDGHIMVGNETLVMHSELLVKVKEEAESAEEEEVGGKEGETTTADMFCIPHLSPDSDMCKKESEAAGLAQGPVPLQHSSTQRSSNAPTNMAPPSVQRPGRQPTKNKPHVCEFCNLGFARASRLERHRRTHTGERPFCCPLLGCERSFSRQDKMKLHMQRAHPWTSCTCCPDSGLVPGLGQRGHRRKDWAPLVPAGAPVVNALAKQRACIENVLRAALGLPPDKNMQLEHRLARPLAGLGAHKAVAPAAAAEPMPTKTTAGATATVGQQLLRNG